jgi:hypothetical protein
LDFDFYLITCDSTDKLLLKYTLLLLLHPYPEPSGPAQKTKLPGSISVIPG